MARRAPAGTDEPRPRRGAALGHLPGRVAPDAPWHFPSIPITTPSNCVTAENPFRRYRRAISAPDRVSRGYASCWMRMEFRQPSSCPPLRHFITPTNSAPSLPRAMRSACTAGFTNATRCWTRRRSVILQYRAADTLEEVTGVRPVWHPHPLLGLQRKHPEDHDGNGPALRFLADGGRRLLRAFARRLTDGRCRIAGRMDSRRRSLSGSWIAGGGLRPQIAPHDILRIFVQEFDAAYEEGGIFSADDAPRYHRTPKPHLDS